MFILFYRRLGFHITNTVE